MYQYFQIATQSHEGLGDKPPGEPTFLTASRLPGSASSAILETTVYSFVQGMLPAYRMSISLSMMDLLVANIKMSPISSRMYRDDRNARGTQHILGANHLARIAMNEHKRLTRLQFPFKIRQTILRKAEV